MSSPFTRFRDRKVAQWAVAYSAAAWVVIQGVDVLGGMFGIPESVGRGVVVALGFGLVLTVVLAWFHGERGRQRVTGIELLVVAAVLVAAGAVIPLVRGQAASDAPSAEPAEEAAADAARDPRSVAVLPFTDLSPGGDQAYFGQGIAEELIAVLSEIEGLRVAARTSSFSLDASQVEAMEIGRRLGVARIVEGTVRKSADRLRIDARLIDATNGFQIWGDRFDTGHADIFAIQDSIAVLVARAFEVHVGGGAAGLRTPGQTADHEAQDLYLQGRYAWNLRTREGLEEAVDRFTRALAIDSAYARARVGLADAYAVLGFYDYRPPSEVYPLAQREARRALSVDSTMAEPWATLAYAALYHDWDWEEAERLFLRSIELDPGYPVAHQWYSNHLVATARFEEAEREMRLASQLDPLSTVAFAAVAWVQLYAGDLEETIRQADAALARDATFHLAYLWSGEASALLGRLDEAERRIRRAVELSGGTAIIRAAFARVLGLQGRGDEARALLREIEGSSAYVPPYEMARAYVGLAEHDTAVSWLERAYGERAHSMAFLAVDPELAALRDHPGYRDLLVRMGLEGVGR